MNSLSDIFYFRFHDHDNIVVLLQLSVHALKSFGFHFIKSWGLFNILQTMLEVVQICFRIGCPLSALVLLGF